MTMSLDHETPSAQPQGVTSTSRSLLAGLNARDDATWSRLVRLYTPLVYHWCKKHQLSHDDIPDVIQEVFKAVAEHIDAFRKDRPQDTFRGWLRVITRNKAMDLYRRLGKEARGEGGTVALQRLEAIPAPEDHETADDANDGEANSILFRQALDLIRDEFREPTWKAFWQVVVEGRRPVDVATDMAMSPGAVRVAKCRVLQRLRLELGDSIEL